MFTPTPRRSAARKMGVSTGILFSLCICGMLSCLSASAGAAPMPMPMPMQMSLMGGGANITVDFADAQQSKFVFVGALPAVPNLNLANLNVSVNLGPIHRDYVLSPEGEGVATPDLFQLRDTGNGLEFIVSTFDNALANVYQSFGLINNTSTHVPVSIPASITFNNVIYSTTLTGSYDAVTNIMGKAFLGVIQRPSDPFATVTHIATLTASPNPAVANQSVTIKGTVSLKNFSGAVGGNLHFGDMSPPVHADGATFQKMLKAGIAHTYTADGVYVVRISLIGGTEIADTRLFVIVGSGFVVNSKNGAVGRLIKNSGGTITLQVALSNVPGAMNAQTNFMDQKGNMAGMPPQGPPPQGGQVGLAPANTFTLPGIYVAEAMALDGAGKPLAVLRHTIAIGTADVGASTVSGAESANQAAPRATSSTDSAITLSSISGKFQFTSSNADSVAFTGTIALPAGYTPKNSAGNDISISMGNVADTVHLNSKGKLASTTDGRISKFTLTTPSLPKGVAAGGETAKVSLTMSTADLDKKGFDSEGVEATVRSDEIGQTSVARFVQVDMLVAGTTYSTLAQVSYTTTTTSSGDFGTITARR